MSSSSSVLNRLLDAPDFEESTALLISSSRINSSESVPSSPRSKSKSSSAGWSIGIVWTLCLVDLSSSTSGSARSVSSSSLIARGVFSNGSSSSGTLSLGFKNRSDFLNWPRGLSPMILVSRFIGLSHSVSKAGPRRAKALDTNQPTSINAIKA